MDDITQEKLLLQKRTLLRDRLKTSGKAGDADIAQLTYLDMCIAEMQSKRKHPLWTKFKNFGEFSVSKAEKKRSFGFYAKMAWNTSMRIAKAVAVAAVYPPVTLPLTAAYMAKKAFEPDFYTLKNRVNYHPRSKGSWLRAVAMSPVFNQPPSISAALSDTGLLDKSFAPDSKGDILQRINCSKKSSHVQHTENVSEKPMPEPDKKQETDNQAKLSPEAAKKIMDSIFIR